MKFLISESGECKRWTGDISELEPGVYYLAKKVETIRVVGGIRSRNLNLSKKIELDDDEGSDPVLQSPNNDSSVGTIHYWMGLRYCKNSNGKLERFEAGDEPKMMNGVLFSGPCAAGKFTVDNRKPIFEDIAQLPVIKPIEKEEVEASVEECLAMAEKITDYDKPKKKAEDRKPKAEKQTTDSVKKISAVDRAKEAVAVAETIDDNFDDEAFLEDMAAPDVNQEANCNLSGDGLTLEVSFEGGKYQKRFKTTTVAESQKKVFDDYLKNDRAMVKELLSGSISTFRKV